MKQKRRVLRYRNRPVEELSREELLKAVYAVMDMLEREQRWHALERETLSVFREARHG